MVPQMMARTPGISAATAWSRSLEYDPDIIGTQECLDFQAQYRGSAAAYAWIGLGRQEDATGEMTAILYRKDA